MEQIGEKQPNGLYVIDTLEDVQNVFQQAKEMEKERMIEFAQLYAIIHCMGDITKNADEYYKETQGGKK
jgi:hypothetical protein